MVYRKQDFPTMENDRIFTMDQRQTCVLRLDVLTTSDWILRYHSWIRKKRLVVREIATNSP